jgi:hypothetical protein
LTYTPITNIYDLFSRDFESVKKSYYQWRDTNHPAVNCAKPLVGSPEYIKYIQEKYDDEYLSDNIINWCKDPEYRTLIDTPSVDAIHLMTCFPEFSKKICTVLEIDHTYCVIKCQVQRPGYISPLHIDSRKTIHATDGEKFSISDPPDHSRWIIFMEDWQPGQVFEIGHQYIKWKKGDVFFWSIRDVPHALANIGYWDRFLILIYARPLH